MQTIEFPSGEATVRGVLFEPSIPPPHPAIVFAHGLLSSHEEFGDFPEGFSQRGYLTLAIDFRGHGASGGMRGMISTDRMVEDLQRALDCIQSRPAVDQTRIALFGHSLGGDAVISTAACDGRVRALVAGATVGRLRDELGAFEDLTYRVVDTINRFQKRFTQKSIYVPYRVTYKDIFADEESRKQAQAKGFLQRSVPADNVPLLLQQDAIQAATKVKVPTLIVQGELDRVVKHSSVHSVFNALAGEKELYEVKGSGHSVWTDCKRTEAFEHIAAWLDVHLKTKHG